MEYLCDISADCSLPMLAQTTSRYIYKRYCVDFLLFVFVTIDGNVSNLDNN